MLFSSPVFLFLFLPIVFSFYCLIKKELQNGFLLLASLLFYFWSENFIIKIMLAYIIFNYVAGMMIHRSRTSLQKKYLLGLAVSFNLILLIKFKYGNFIVDNLNQLCTVLHRSHWQLPSIYLPLGISFITFHSISYLVDIYRQKAAAQKDPVKFGLYMALFPQLIAGPIVRYHDIASQLSARQVTVEACLQGAKRFIIGLAKKMVLANTFGQVADTIFALPADALNLQLAWLGAICYTLQIYYDFSGYSDMAIGLSRLFGFTILENFNRPYLSRSIREFWQRWHISLSNWFRDYLYVPLGGNRCPPYRNFFNLLTVFFLCGLWHGASWTFVVWGLYHGFFLIAEKKGLGNWLAMRPAILQHGYTLLVVMIGWVIFRAETLHAAYVYLRALCGFGQGHVVLYPIRSFLNNEVILILLAGTLGILPLYQSIQKRLARVQALPLQFLFLSTVFFLSIMQLAVGTYNPFIYFRF